MASENVEDWEVSLPSTRESEVSMEEEEESMDQEELMQKENLEKMEEYVKRMAYRAVTPPVARPRTAQLAKHKQTAIVGTYIEQYHVLSPRLRRQRIKRMTSQYAAISTEQLEQIIKHQKAKERRKENMMKKKQELYYEMLTKLERQCRSQYLNVLIKKFAKYVSNLATTMHIPEQLVEPYSRMQRGIFCNILVAIGIQPASQSAMFYNTPEGMEFEVCHKLAHALLSLIIKGLDSAAAKSPDDLHTPETDFDMDNYIKDRLMCAAEKKILNTRKKSQPPLSALDAIFKKCHDFSLKNNC